MALTLSTFEHPTNQLLNFSLENFNKNSFIFDEDFDKFSKIREKINNTKTNNIFETIKIKSEEDSIVPFATLLVLGFFGSKNDLDSETSSIKSNSMEENIYQIQKNENLFEDFRVFLKNREKQYEELLRDLPESVDFQKKQNFLLENEALKKLIDIIQLMLFLEKLPKSHIFPGFLYEKYLKNINKNHKVKFTPEEFYEKFLNLLQNLSDNPNFEKIVRKINKLKTYSIISKNFPILLCQNTGNFRRKAILTLNNDRKKFTAFLFSKMIIIGKNKEKLTIKDVEKVRQKFSKKTIVLTMKNKKEIVLIFDDFEEMDLWYKYLCQKSEIGFQENFGVLDIKNRIFN